MKWWSPKEAGNAFAFPQLQTIVANSVKLGSLHLNAGKELGLPWKKFSEQLHTTLACSWWYAN